MELSQELQKKSVSAEELAMLIDAVGECAWQRSRRYVNDQAYLGFFIFFGLAMLCFISLIICMGSGWIAGILILGAGTGFPIYLWQRWVCLRGELEDMMLIADEKVIAKAISLAKWEYVGFDSAERIERNGRTELEKFQVMRTFEPIDVEKAYRSMLDAEISEALTKVARDHKRIKGGNIFFGFIAAAITRGIELLVIKFFWPHLLTRELSHTNEKLLILPPLLIGMGTYALLMHLRDKDHKSLQGLDTEQLRNVKRRAILTKKKKSDESIRS